jgi:hypothetical protein
MNRYSSPIQAVSMFAELLKNSEDVTVVGTSKVSSVTTR